MKNVFQPTKFLLAFAFILSVLHEAKALSGTYTIDSSQLASSTNYRDFLSAVSDLRSGTRSDGGTSNGAGVTGPVVFEVAAGTFPGQLDITGITGVNATNTITFDGGAGNAASRIVIFSTATAQANAFTVRITNQQYITLRNLTITGGSNNFGWPVHIMGSSSNTKIKECIINFTTAFSAHTGTAFCGVVLNNNATSPTSAASTASNVEIDSNTIEGGYGNYLLGTSSTGISFRNNQVRNSNLYGVYLQGLAQAKVNQNVFNLSPVGVLNSTGIYMTSCTATSGNIFEINGNRITNAGQSGIYMTSITVPVTPRSQLFNNEIAGGFRNSNPYGIFIGNNNAVSAWDVFHNSVNLDNAATGSSSAALYVQNCCSQNSPNNIDVRNNVFAVTSAASSSYAFYYPSATILTYVVTSAAAFNYNLYYKEGMGPLTNLFYAGGAYQTPVNLINNNGYNTNSILANPNFMSGSDLRSFNTCYKGTPLAQVTQDLNGRPRSSAAPVIGAFENQAAGNDLGVVSVTAPVAPFLPGSHDLNVLIRNYGSNTVTSANVSYILNGGFPVTVTYSGSLAPCATDTVKFTGLSQPNFAAGIINNMKVYTEYPNGVPDTVTFNDTLTIPLISPALSGNYTIDPTQPSSPVNFVSFTEAVNTLNTGGVNGPVNITVMGSAPFNEQVSLNAVPGISATNTITFDGGTGNAANRVLTFNTSQFANYVFRINNTPYVTLRNLTIRSTGSAYGWPVHILGDQSNNIKVKSCLLNYIGGNGANSSGTSNSFAAIVVNGSPASVTSAQTLANNLELDSNTITGGEGGILVYGRGPCQNIQIRYNTINGTNHQGIYIYSSYSSRINNNIINMRSLGGSASSVGISSNYCSTSGAAYAHEIMNNVVNDAGQYGIYLNSFNNGASMRARIVNNMIGGTARSTDPAGIYLYNGTHNTDLWHNTINLAGLATTTQSGALKLLTNIVGIDARNNQFTVSDALSTSFAVYAELATSFTVLDYNNYFKPNATRLVGIGTAVYSSANFKGANGQNQNSMSMNPAYTSLTNLRSNLLCNHGISIAAVTTDFEGDLRSTPPDIGADENVNGVFNDLAVSQLIEPSVPLLIGTNNLRVMIRNNGSSAVSSAVVSYSVNGGPAQDIQWYGSLNPCDSAIVEFNATSGASASDQRFTIFPGASYTFKVYAALPNNTTDDNTLNDTLVFGPYCPSLTGTFYIDSAKTTASLDTFPSFASAVLALNCGGVSGPVTFNVLKGTYNGQLTLNEIPGASAVNTVTFDGGAGNDSTRIVTFAATVNGARHTWLFNAAKYVTLNNLTIKGTGATFGWPLHIFGLSSYITVRNCIIDLDSNGANGTSDNFVPLVVNGSATNVTTGAALTYILIEGNKIRGGNTGTYLCGTGVNANNIVFRNNKTYNAHTNGLYVVNMLGTKITGNTITMRPVLNSSTGMYLTSLVTNATGITEVSKNRIYDAGQYGIQLLNSTPAALRANMINNSIGGRFRNTSAPTGIYLSSSGSWNIVHNSVLIDTSATGSTASGGVYITGSTLLDFRNNNMAITHTGAGANMLPFRTASGVTFVTGGLNYNNYFKAGTPATLINVGGTNYTPANYNTAAAGGLNSISNNSGYVSGADLIPVMAGNNGVLIPALAPRDINDSIRNNPPDIGAFEIPSSFTTDAGLIASISPDTALVGGVKDVVVVVKNFGLTPVTSFTLGHTVNGINLQDSAFSGLNMVTGDSVVVTLSGSKSAIIPGGIMTTYRVFIVNPNGGTDDNTLNDTLTIGPKVPTLNGIYTIDPAGSGVTNFVSFRAAVNALNTAGVSGPVTFMVAAATYNEQVTLGAIAGVSAVNTVTFDGGAGNRATRIIDTAANTAANFWTVKLNNSPYVTLRNLTIRARGAAYGAAVQIAGTSDYSRIKNCSLEIAGNGATATTQTYVGLLISNLASLTSLAGSGARVTNLEIDSNTIIGGHAGIYAYGLTGTPYQGNNMYRYNTILNAYVNGAYFYYNQGITFQNNTIALRWSSGINTYGVNLEQCYNQGTAFHDISGNNLTRVNRYGIYLSNLSSTNRCLVSNNMITGFNSTGYGIYAYFASNFDFYHNTIYLDTVVTSTQSSALYLSYGSNIEVKNNIFAAFQQGSAIPLFMNPVPTGYLVIDNNNLFKFGQSSTTPIISIAGTTYGPASFAGAGGYNANSVSVNPGFIGNGDLHLVNPCAGKASSLAAVTRDIDGDTRSAMTNLGADEASGLTNDVGIVSIAPFGVGLQDVKVLIRNFGNNPLTSVNVSYAVNGGIGSVTQWTGTLNPCDTVTVVFTGVNQYNFSAGVQYTIEAYTSLPNLATDPKTSNDTIAIGPMCVSLAGIYTIDPAGSGSSNYPSFNDAISALGCGGVSAPVVFKVAPGTYNEQLVIGAIPGVSAVNTITFDGDSAQNRVLSFSATSNTAGYTVKFEGASFVQFRNLKIVNDCPTNNYGVPVQISTNSQFISIKRCIIEVPLTATGQGCMGILISSAANVQSPYTAANGVSNIEMDSNTITGGYSGIWVYGSSSPFTFNIAARDNKIDSAIQNGVYLFYVDKITFERNILNMRETSTSSVGVSFNNCYAQGTNIHLVNNNQVYNAGATAYYMSFVYGATQAARSQMINNVAGGTFRSTNANAVFMQYCYYWDMWHNTFNLNSATTADQYSTAHFTNCQQMDVRNNQFIYSPATGSAQPLNIATANQFTTLNYNNYFNAAGSNLVNDNGVYYNSTNLNSGTQNQQSRSINPAFASPKMLAASNACINGVAIPSVPLDITGATRNSPPDIGAYEFLSSINNDIGVSFLNSPAIPFLPGSYPVNVRISNFGGNAVTSATIKYSINGGAPVSYTYNGSIQPCDAVSVTISASPVSFASNSSYSLKIWSELPNGSADGNTANDTFNMVSCPALPGGNYTIDAAGSGPNNFTSFNAATSAMNCGGIAGPVTFTVAPGTYTEQVTLLSIIGASATNTIVFDGVDAATRTIDFTATTTTAAHTFRISNTPYVTVRNFTITASGVNYGNPVHIMGSSDYARVKNCVISFNGAARTSASGAFSGIIINNDQSVTNPTSNGSKAGNMEIDSNRISYGYYGIVDYGNNVTPYPGNVVYRNNTVDSSYYYGIYVGMRSGVKLHGNTVSMRSGNINSMGIYLNNTSNNPGAFHEITNNKVVKAGRYGIYQYFSNYSGSTALRCKLINNMIGGGFTSATARGIYMEYSQNWDIYHNSVNLDFATSSNQNSAAMIGTGATGCDIRNNHFAYTATTGSGIGFYSSQTFTQATLNYNNYYNGASATGGLLYANGTTYTAANFAVAAGINSNSLNGDPGYASPLNLVTGGCFKGVQIPSVPADIEGQARNNPPDIGATESDTNDVGIISISSPVEPVMPGPQDIVVQLKNFGGNVVNDLSVSYQVNNGTVVTQNLTTLNLQPCSTITVTFTGGNQFNFPTGRALITAYTAMPNGNADRDRTNDTMNKALCGPLSGTYTINPSGSGATNFTSFNQAINSMLCAGIMGPVQFDVAAGVYNEQVTMPVITGASAINTITFDGGAGNAASRVLTFASADNNARHTVRFNSEHVTFRNITIQATGVNYGWGVHYPANANNNNVIGCIVDIASATAQTSAGTQFCGIVVSGSNTSPTTAASINNIRIDSNTVKSGYYSIVAYGSTATPDTNVYIRGNTVSNAYNTGIYAYYIEGLNVDHNTVSTRAGNPSMNQMGIYLNNCNQLSFSTPISVNGNRVFNVSQYGIYIATSAGSLGASASIHNNMVGGGFQSSSATGIYLFNNCANWDVYHNTVNLDFPTTNETYAAMMVYINNTNIRMKNNNFAVTAPGSTGLPLYSYNTTSFAPGGLNFNNYYKADVLSTGTLINVGGAYTPLSYMLGGGASSFNKEPGFRGNLNLHTMDGCFNGDSLGIVYDIDGDVRASYADIGADEVSDMNNDIGVIALLQPAIPLVSGMSDVQVIVKNFGTNPVYKANVSYTVNGGMPTGLVIFDTIHPCDTALVTFTGGQQYNFASGSYQIKAYTWMPNDSDDISMANDTFSTPLVCIALSGTYTIDPAGSGPNNFTSFQAALDALQCSGVSGPVTFEVAAGTYTEQLVVSSVLGASATNTITFTGGAGNAATRILTYGATTNANRQTVRFTGASYISFEHLTIRNTGSAYAWPVHVFSGSRNLKFRNNIIEITGNGAAGATTDFINVVVSASTTSPSGVIRADSLEFDSNTINGGYASIYDYNGQSVFQSFNANTLNRPNYYGLYIYNSYEVKIRKNIINMSPTGNINSVGMYFFVIGTTTGRNNEISGNKITDMGQYGIYLYSSSGFSTIGTSRIENNMIGGGFRNTAQHSGIYSEYSNSWNVWFNTVNMDTACTAMMGAIHMTNGSGIDVRNNIFAVTYDGANANSIPFYAATVANTSALDYNNYYKAGSANTLVFHGVPLSPSTFVGASGYNLNSFSIDPLFTSSKDLHVNSGCNNGIVLGSGVDIDGDIRTTPPDVGADEVTSGYTDNIGVTGIISPSMPLATGTQDIVVILANLGNNVVTNATVSYSVNGGAPVSILYTDSLQPCDTALVVFTGADAYTFNQGSSYSIKAYTSYPNWMSDNNTIDDTASFGPVCPTMYGAYTIDPAGSGVRNFTTFNAAISALGCAGISDDVTFTVANGTYTEQVTVMPVVGVNDTNRVTFTGQSKTGVTLTFNAFSMANPHTLRISNASFITFSNMTIQSGGSSLGVPVHILGSSHNTWVKNCVIRVGGAGATATSQNFIGVLVNNSPDLSSVGNGSTVNNLEIDSNYIFAGYYSIYLYGRTASPYANNNAFRGNTIDSSYYYGFYAYYNSGVKFNGNRLTLRSSTGSTNSYGVYLFACYNNNGSSHEVSGNRVLNASAYGINITISSNSAINTGKFYNNMVGGGFRSTGAYGIYFQSSNFWNAYHNSVNMDMNTSGNQYAAFSVSTASNLHIRNNILAYTATTGTGIPLYITGTYTGTIDNNNYHNAVGSAATLVNINGTTATAANFTTNGGGANSYNTLPGFTGPKDLTITMPNVKGDSTLGVLTDIEGQLRATPPDVGADEYFGVLDIGVLAVDSPTTASFCGRNRNIIVRLRNYGNQVVNSAQIYYNVNGVPSGTYSWTGTLAPGTTSAQINIGSYAFTGGAYEVAAYSFMPNGLLTDTIHSNDTAFKSFNTTPSVTPTVSLTASQTVLCSGVEVTFVASHSGGGATPSLQWRKNGITLSVPGDTLKTTALNDGDSFIVILTSSATCATPSIVFSNSVRMVVGLTVAPDVAIAATTNTICAGTNVTFTATPLNGGFSPTYTWFKNGVQTGGDSARFDDATLQDGDSVNVVLHSSLGCANPPHDTSSYIKMTVNPLQLTSATISASTTSFCAGTSVTFAATTVNQGTNPVYQWRRNGVPFGPNNDTLVINSLSNNDSISLVVTSNALCATPAVFESNKIGVTVIPLVVPSVSIGTTTGTICTGSTATFTATPLRAGVNATYNWTVNSVPSGTGSTFSSASFSNNDTIRLFLTADTLCATPQTVASNNVVIKVRPYVAPSVSITPLSPAVCAGGSVSFTATPVNGGTAPSYQWFRNGVAVGTDSARYLGVFNTNDSISVRVTSNEMCLSTPTATSASAHVSITLPVTPSVSVAASATSVCANGTVTFTATPVNGGSTPVYQWKKNGANIGTNNAVQTFGSINNNDSFWVVLTSNAGCAVPPTATSAKVGIGVTPNVTPSVTITASATTICASGSVTFTATPVNGGAAPSYQWKKNGFNIGTDSAVQTFTGISNNDNFTVVLTSNATCASPATATSSGRTIFVTPNATPAATIIASKSSICPGESVTFTATSVNGGTPSYQWKVNGVNAGTNSSSFTTTAISGDDTVYVELTSSVTCVTTPTVISNKIRLNANPAVLPAVSVQASAASVCAGTSITFAATPVNGGTAPSYQWKVNGVNVGSNNDSFTTSTLTVNDSVYVVMTSNALCANPASVTSAKAAITINAPVTPEISIQASTNSICRGSAVTYNATITNGGTSPSYKWMKNGVVVGTDADTYTTTELLPDEDVTCILTTSLSCVTSTTVVAFAPGVLVRIPPAKPVVMRNANTLSTVFASQNYQWIKNDTDIVSANAPTYIMTENGVYSVRVDSNGCSSTSDPLSVTDILTGIREVSTIGSLNVYPNPASVSAYLEVRFTTSDVTEISLVDMYGKLVKTIPAGVVNGFEGTIGLDDVADGVYFVLIRHGNDMAQKRLVKAAR